MFAAGSCGLPRAAGGGKWGGGEGGQEEEEGGVRAGRGRAERSVCAHPAWTRRRHRKASIQKLESWGARLVAARVTGKTAGARGCDSGRQIYMANPTILNPDAPLYLGPGEPARPCPRARNCGRCARTLDRNRDPSGRRYVSCRQSCSPRDPSLMQLWRRF